MSANKKSNSAPRAKKVGKTGKWNQVIAAITRALRAKSLSSAKKIEQLEKRAAAYKALGQFEKEAADIQMIAALRKVQVEDTLQALAQARAEREILASIAQALVDQEDYQRIGQIVGERIQKFFNAEIAGIGLYDQEAGIISVPYYYEHGVLKEVPSYEYGKGVTTHVIKTRRPIYLPTAKEAEKYNVMYSKELPAETMLMSPILSGKKVLGVISIQHSKPYAYGKHELEILTAIANSMAVALENARLFAETNRRNAELAVITSIQNALADELDIQTIYDKVGDKLREIFNVGAITINVYDLEANTNSYVYGYEEGKRTPNITLPIKAHHRYVLDQGDFFLLNTGAKQFFRRFNAKAPQGTLPRSFLSVRLPQRGNQITAVILLDIDHENAFTQADVRLLQAIANSMAVALENARLFDEIQKSNREISDSLAQQTAISDILRTLAGTPTDMKPVLHAVAKHAAQLTEANDVQIYQVDGDQLRQITHFGPLPALQDGEGLPLVPGLVAGRVVLERRTIHLEDARKLSKEEYPESVKLQRRLGHRTTLGVPLIRDGQAIGLIVVRRNVVRPFTENQISLLKTFADQAAIAIEKARLQNESNRLLDETTQRNAELAVINSVQQGLASKLDFQEIINLVGEKVGEIFNADTALAFMYDDQRDWGLNSYYADRGRPVLIPDGPLPRPSLAALVVDSRQPLVIATMEESEQLGAVKRPPGESEEDLNESILFVPILAGDKAIGALSVQSYMQNAYDQNDLRLLQTLASSMSVALENARLFHETTQRNAELAVINSVQEGLSRSLKLQEIIDLVGEKVGEIFHADTVFAGLYDESRDWGLYVYYVDGGKRVPVVDGPVIRPSLAAYVADTKKPLLLGTKEEGAKLGAIRVVRRKGEEDRNESILGMPIMKGENVTGGISVQSYKRNAYSQDDLRLLQTLAGNMSVALENARLFDETAQRNAELAVINSVQEAMAKQLDIQGIYEAVGEKIKDIFNAQSVILGAFDHEAKVSHPYYLVEKGMRFSPDPFPFTGLIKELISSKQTVLINEDMAAKIAEYGMIVHEGTEPAKSGIWVPLVAGDSAIGFMSLQNVDQENAFSESDVRLLETLANGMSVALENARLFDETAQRNAELAIINSVQDGIASKLDVHAIYELVGEKLRQIFPNADVTVGRYDPVTDIATGEYVIEHGKRTPIDAFKVDGIGFIGELVRHPHTQVINENMEQALKEHGSFVITGTSMPKSFVNVPLVIGGVLQGLLELQDMDRESAFSESDVRLLETIANSVSIALENARLFDETSQRNAELAIINAVQDGLASKLEIESIIDLVGKKLGEIFPDMDVVQINLYDKLADLIHIPYCMEKGERHEHESRKPWGIRKLVLASRQAVVNNGPQDEGRLLELAKKYGVGEMVNPLIAGEAPKSVLFVPLLVGDQVRGIISLQSMARENAFPDSTVQLLGTLASSMSVALENARLFDETERLLDESRKKEEELSTINTVSQAVASELELASLIELIGVQVRKIFKADIAYLALYDKEKDLIEFPYLFGDTLPPLKMGDGIVSQIIQQRKPLLINSDKGWEEAGIHKRVGKRSMSFLGVPILVGTRAIGAISVQSTQKAGRFDEADQHLLSTIAANVGAAIENARLFAEVARQKEYFETFFQYSPAAVVVVDFDGKVISWNPAAQTLFGYTAQEAIGHDVDSLVANDPRVEAEARMYTKKFTGELGRVEVKGTRTRKDGSLVDVEVKGLPIAVEGKMVGLLVIYHDISEIEQARRAAEEANQAKSAFLANMSHELRTPLNAIIGFTRIVRRKGEEALPGKQLENLDKVLVSAEHLLGLINTILDIAKIEAGRMELQLSDFNLGSLVEGVLATSQPLAKPGVQLLSSLPPKLPQMHSDEEKIRQVLLNLLSNAAKFTHEGSIRVNGELKGEMISLAVQDTGIGIAPENLAKIFEEFQQADNTTTREYGGTGLGLSISRSLAKLLGGDLTVASVEGQGSTFTLTLPMRLGPAVAVTNDGKEEIAAPSLDPDKPIVLVIDDQPDMFHILQQNLGDAGYQVVGALSGEEGIEKARSLHPFAITLDIMMPRKDGWQVLYELKNDAETKSIPVIILTIVDNKPMGFRLGASDYLVKPLSEKSVLDALERLAKSNGGVHPHKLLVVDDDPKVADLVQQTLEGEDFVIETSGDGAQALSHILLSKPDAILLDLLMPRMDGFQFIEELQKHPQLRAIPIIVLTAKSLSNEEQAALENSVAKIIKKQGLGSETLIKEIHQIVSSSAEKA
jgi:PAS domain S-box-containing protein